MKKAMLILAASMLLPLVAGGEDQNSSDQLHTVQGCLSYTDHNYVITGGNSPRQFRIIEGDTSGLRGKLGHTVNVTGIVGQNNPRENTTEPPNEGTTTGVTYNTIIARSVKDVAANCSYPGFERRD